jgi:hypothetical protein
MDHGCQCQTSVRKKEIQSFIGGANRHVQELSTGALFAGRSHHVMFEGFTATLGRGSHQPVVPVLLLELPGTAHFKTRNTVLF